MVLVAPGICRFTVNGSYAGRPVANVLDYRIDTTGSTMGRAEAVNNQAQDILTQWTEQMLPVVQANYIATSVSYVDLDEADGPTGSVTSSDDADWPAPGVAEGPDMPANVAGLVRKQIIGTRGRRSGRMYLCGLSEEVTAADQPNTISEAAQSFINGQLAAFLANTNNTDTLGTAFSSDLVVVHTRQPDPEDEPIYNGFSVVDSLIVEGLLATQRRRLRG